MAELLVRVADKVPPADPRYHLFLKAGEVVVVCPDGHPWSRAERENPDWRILRLPKLTESEAMMLIGGRKVVPETGKLPLRREFAIDLSRLPDDERGLDFQQVENLKVRHEDAIDHRVFPNEKVFG